MNLKTIKISGITFGVIFAIGLLGWFAIPALLKTLIKKQKVLTPGSEIRDMWMKTPFPLNFHINVFNITNPEETAQGSKPILKEIGPYVFDEWKDKYDLIDNDTDDTVTFNMRNTFIFRPDKSNGLTGEEIITMPHPLVQPISISIKRERIGMLPIIAEGLQTIFPKYCNQSPFIQAAFLDIFYRGILIDCSSKVFGAKAICMQFRTNKIKGGLPYNSTHYLFSLLAAGNGTNAGRYTVLRGKKNSSDVGRVLILNNKTELNNWEITKNSKTKLSQHCNEYQGTDSTIFPPLMKKETGLWTVSPELCRSLGLNYETLSQYEGIPTLRFSFDFGDIKNEEENQCFCNEKLNQCPIKGTMNLQKCNGAPMIVSLPHFYKADESLLNNVIGLKPIAEKHEIYMDVELMTGTPMSVAKRLQFNLDVEAIPEIESMANLTNIVMPLFWIEENVKLNQTYVKLLKDTIFFVIKCNTMLKWSFSLIGFFGLLISYILYKNKSRIVPTEISSSSQLKIANK